MQATQISNTPRVSPCSFFCGFSFGGFVLGTRGEVARRKNHPLLYQCPSESTNVGAPAIDLGAWVRAHRSQVPQNHPRSRQRACPSSGTRSEMGALDIMVEGCAQVGGWPHRSSPKRAGLSTHRAPTQHPGARHGAVDPGRPPSPAPARM